MTDPRTSSRNDLLPTYLRYQYERRRLPAHEPRTTTPYGTRTKDHDATTNAYLRTYSNVNLTTNSHTSMRVPITDHDLMAVCRPCSTTDVRLPPAAGISSRTCNLTVAGAPTFKGGSVTITTPAPRSRECDYPRDTTQLRYRNDQSS
jgi:hypothetical protein